MAGPDIGQTVGPDIGPDIGMVRWNDAGLVPVVVQDHIDREVLMLAWADAPALTETLGTGWATYYSRSRGGRWRKGETSGHVQRVVRVRVDCDGDTLLYEVEQTGPACHTGTPTCFTDRELAVAAAPVTARPVPSGEGSL